VANEITVTTDLKCKNGLLDFSAKQTTIRVDQATARAGSFTVDVGTSEENIAFGDITPGYVRFTNLDATNFVRLRFTTTANAIRLPPNGGMALIRVDGVTVIAIADTAACKIQVEAVNT
jgi:hypothetical protein